MKKCFSSNTIPWLRKLINSTYIKSAEDRDTALVVLSAHEVYGIAVSLLLSRQVLADNLYHFLS